MHVKQCIDLKEMCQNKPKLRTFLKFKDFGSVPVYLLKPMSFVCRKHLALIRLSNLSLRLETGRFERPRLEFNERFCLSCTDNISVEDEFHFIYKCVSYNDLRTVWFDKLTLPDNFEALENYEKLSLVLNCPENVKCTAQYIVDAFNLRSKIVKNL